MLASEEESPEGQNHSTQSSFKSVIRTGVLTMGPNSDPGSQPLTGSVFGGHTPLFSTSLLIKPLVLFNVVGVII